MPFSPLNALESRLRSRSVPARRKDCRPPLRLVALGRGHRATLSFGTLCLPCVIGRGGILRRKREGDGATPAGTLRPRLIAYRPDRGPRPYCCLPAVPIRRADGWCDDARSARYNRPVPAGASVSHEHMWRTDSLYDLVVVLGHNDRPVRKGRGSAIFIHLARPDGGATEGCIALKAADLRKLMLRLMPATPILIRP